MKPQKPDIRRSAAQGIACVSAAAAAYLGVQTGAAALMATPPAGAAGVAQARQSRTDWPQFRGPFLNGVSPEKGIRKDWAQRPPTVRWKVAMSDDGYAGPSVAGGVVYIVDHVGAQDIVRALDLESGAERWRYAYAEEARNVYGYCRTTPTVADGRVYTMSREGLLHCLDARRGTLVWKRSMKEDFGGKSPMWKYAAPPLKHGKQIIVWPGGAASTIVALHPATGATLWHGGEGDVPGYGMPVPATLGGKRQYVMTVWKGFVGAEEGTGKVLWRIPWETTDGTNVASPIVIGDSVFVTSSYGMGCAVYDVGPNGARERWRNTAIRAHMNTPVLHEGLIYGIGDPGYLVCLNPRDGTVRWRQMGFEKGGLLAVDGVLIAVNGSGGDVVMVRLNPERYEELGRFTPLGGQSWSPPVVAGGKLLVRNRKALACIDLH